MLPDYMQKKNTFPAIEFTIGIGMCYYTPSVCVHTLFGLCINFEALSEDGITSNAIASDHTITNFT